MLNLQVNKKIYLAGHTGLVGSTIYRKFNSESYCNLLTADYPGLDLTRQNETEDFFKSEKPEIVIVAIAKVSRFLPNNTHCVNL